MISFNAGEDVYQPFVPVLNTDLTDFADWELRFDLLIDGRTRTATLSYTIGNGITITDVTEGEFIVYIPASDTTTLQQRTYTFRMWRTDAGHVTKLAEGPVRVR